MRVILLAVLIFLGSGCAKQQIIQCFNDKGEITYLGPYDEERRGAYIVHVNAFTDDYHSKHWCDKIHDQEEAS
jgi:hypothetical protein